MPAGSRALILFSLGFFLAGCGGRGRQELLENELRARDVQMRELLNELGKSEWRGDGLRREVDVLRKGGSILPEHAGPLFGLRRIVLGRSTGGVDDDGLPGDEALIVFLEPRDTDDHIIKVPGSRLLLTVLEINFQGLKVPLCAYDFNPEQLRKSWKEGLLSTGYYLRIPWKVFPRTENLRIVARLLLPDERVFEADRDIKVGLVPGKSLPDPSYPLPLEMGPPPVFMPGPGPELGPPPGIFPGPGPILPPPVKEAPAHHWQPVGRPKTAIQPISQWEPASLVGAVKLGIPQSNDVPPLP